MYEMDEYTVSLLHFDDGLKDECGNAWTTHGNVTVSTDQKVVGNSSLYTPASSFLTSTNDKYAFGTGDFTIDFWMYYESGYSGVSSSQVTIGGVGIAIQSDHIWFGDNTGTATKLVGPPGFISNNWAHYAFVRKSGKIYWFVNGNLKNTTSSNLSINTKTFAINSRYSNGLAGGVAYYDEFRISNVARWTSDFTPPSTTTETIATPSNLIASAGDSQVSLPWNAVEGAASYNVKRSTTAGGPYTTIATNVLGTSYLNTTVANGTTYYYVVTAVDSSGNESANSNEASATPVAAQAPTGQALLRVTMIDSSEREYQLSASEIDGFINWYTRTIGTGTTCYVLNKKIGMQNSKEYLAFDKIISFEVMELTK